MTWVLLPAESKARFDSAGQDGTSQSRLTYWKDGIKIAGQYPLLGIGFNNWLPYYRTYYNPKAELPHNLFVECLVELGYPALFVFLLMVGGNFWLNSQTRRLTGKHARAPDRLAHYMTFGLDGALIGYLTSGFFVTVFYYPYFWVNLGFSMALSRYVAQRGVGVPARRSQQRVASTADDSSRAPNK